MGISQPPATAGDCFSWCTSGRQPGSSRKAAVALFALSPGLFVAVALCHRVCLALVQIWLCIGPKPAYDAPAAMLKAGESRHACNSHPWL
jgi:hypothetical protein